MTKQRHFLDGTSKALKSNSSKLTGRGNSAHDAVEIPDDEAPPTRQDESDVHPALGDLPVVRIRGPDGDDDDDDVMVADNPPPSTTASRRKRPHAALDLTVESSDEDASSMHSRVSPPSEEGDEKKRLETTYEGFSIYGHVLCLVVKKRDRKGKGVGGGGQAMMEEWITSTQQPVDEDV